MGKGLRREKKLVTGDGEGAEEGEEVSHGGWGRG